MTIPKRSDNMTKQDYLEYVKRHNLTWYKGKLIDINAVPEGCTHTPISDCFEYSELKMLFDEYFDLANEMFFSSIKTERRKIYGK